MRKLKWAGAGLLVVVIAAVAATVAFARPSAHAVSAPLPGNAAVGQITIDGIKGGDSVETPTIEVLSWSWGMNQSGTFTRPGTANIHDIVITKSVDKASPTLFRACANGEHIDKVLLEIFRPGSGSDVYYTIKLENVVISSVQVSGSGASPAESVSFNFQKVSIEYKAKDGTTTQGTIVNPNAQS